MQLLLGWQIHRAAFCAPALAALNSLGCQVSAAEPSPPSTNALRGAVLDSARGTAPSTDALRAAGSHDATPQGTGSNTVVPNGASPMAAPGGAPPTAEAPKDGTCPEEMAIVGDSCVDRYEAHLLRRGTDNTWAPHPAYERPLAGSFMASSTANTLPQAYISRVEAAEACANAGKRLCSVNEWYRACRGPDETTYPYGPKYERGRCNVGQPHLLSEHFGQDARAWKYDEHFNHPGLIRDGGLLAESGKFSGCSNGFGVYDMVGNLHEWVADRADPSLANKLPVQSGIKRTLRRKTGNGIFMGGFFSTTSQHGHGCEFVTVAHEPSYHDYSTGFRCCRDR